MVALVESFPDSMYRSQREGVESRTGYPRPDNRCAINCTWPSEIPVSLQPLSDADAGLVTGDTFLAGDRLLASTGP
jgi:hypothetical protein